MPRPWLRHVKHSATARKNYGKLTENYQKQPSLFLAVFCIYAMQINNKKHCSKPYFTIKKIIYL